MINLNDISALYLYFEVLELKKLIHFKFFNEKRTFDSNYQTYGKLIFILRNCQSANFAKCTNVKSCFIHFQNKIGYVNV